MVGTQASFCVTFIVPLITGQRWGGFVRCKTEKLFHVWTLCHRISVFVHSVIEHLSQRQDDAQHRGR